MAIYRIKSDYPDHKCVLVEEGGCTAYAEVWWHQQGADGPRCDLNYFGERHSLGELLGRDRILKAAMMLVMRWETFPPWKRNLADDLGELMKEGFVSNVDKGRFT